MTAAERVIDLLAAARGPMRRGAIARELGWTRQRAAQVLDPMLDDGRLVWTIDCSGSAGRPGYVYTLASRSVVPPEQRLALKPDTIVLTPADREARIIRLGLDGFADLELLGVKPRCNAFVTLYFKLLRAFQPGRGRPAPVRIPLAA